MSQHGQVGHGWPGGWKVQFEFVMLDWAAYADGLSTREAWLDWARAPAALPAEQVQQVPALPEMHAMMRRRVDRLGRMACQVAYWCQQAPSDVPLVFASRYGDADRSLSLLGDLVLQQALSPAGFALSVHNAVAALYSIARGDTRNAVVVAAGRASATAALAEAAALLADGEPEVLVVCYEAPLPEHYRHFQDESVSEYAWAWRVAGTASSAQGVRVRVTVGGAELASFSNASDPLHGLDWSAWPEGLLALRQVLAQWAGASDEAVSRCHRPGVSSRWSTHA